MKLFSSDQDVWSSYHTFLGYYHAGLKKYGFLQDMWDRLGEELIDVLVVQVDSILTESS